MQSDPNKQNTETTPKTSEDEPDALDGVFENAERVCCGKSEAKICCGKSEAKKQDEATVTDPVDVEEGAPPTPPLNHDTSTVKEAIEVQAHFDSDEEEDGLTITSNIDHTSYAMNGDDSTYKSFATQIGRQKLRVLFLFFLLLLVIILALSVGLSQKGNGKPSTSSTSAAEVGSPQPGESPTSTGGNQASDSNTESQGSEGNPTECEASISVDRSCYNRFEERIVATFQECEATSGAWVSLYPEGSDPQSLEEPEFGWVYTCGTRNCVRPVAADTLELTRSLPAGTWQAVLISGENVVGPYAAVAVSDVFEVSELGCP